MLMLDDKFSVVVCITLWGFMVRLTQEVVFSWEKYTSIYSTHEIE